MRSAYYDFRLLTEEDLTAIVAVESSAPWRWTPTQYRDSFAAGHRLLGCEWHSAREAPQLCAFAITSQVLDEVSLLNICVAGDRQGQGLGQALLKKVLADSRQQGGRRLYLEVRVSNHRAIRLYERQGFLRDGLRRGYYPGGSDKPREDALLFSIGLE